MQHSPSEDDEMLSFNFQHVNEINQQVHFTDVIGIDSLKQGRFVVLNAWRNISNIPIQKNHLAVLDEQSTVKPDDYLTGDFYGNVSLNKQAQKA